LAEIMRDWKYLDLHQLDLLHVRQRKASGNKCRSPESRALLFAL
jgi:hypothetical protein